MGKLKCKCCNTGGYEWEIKISGYGVCTECDKAIGAAIKNGDCKTLAKHGRYAAIELLDALEGYGTNRHFARDIILEIFDLFKGEV
jgi:hypothetical protein